MRYAYAHPADRERFATDESGCLVYPATIREVLPDGLLVLDYDCGGDGVEEAQHVWPRVRLPHQPKFLKGQLAIMLRRNLGHGRVLEGLEVRWSLVSNILDALMKLGPWRLDGSRGPMHKWYDNRLFDAMGYEDIAAKIASKDNADQPMDIRTGAGLMQAGFDLSLIHI